MFCKLEKIFEKNAQITKLTTPRFDLLCYSTHHSVPRQILIPSKQYFEAKSSEKLISN